MSEPMKSHLWRALIVAAAAVAVAGVVALSVPDRLGLTGADSHLSPTPSTTSVPTPIVQFVDTHDYQVPWDAPLRVKVTDGSLANVIVIADGSNPLPGAVSADGTTWQSTSQSLFPLGRYRVTADVTDVARRTTTRTLETTATDSPKHLNAVVSPGDRETVGVGMPVSVRFSTDVPAAQRATVQSRLTVSTAPTVAGAWHWINSREVHWRPPAYWQPSTKVTVHADLTRLDLGGGLWGNGVRDVSFSIGEAHVSTADVTAHTFTVTSKGQVVKTIPMSAGRDKYPTKGGVHIALEKSQVVTMDSQTVGIPRNSPDGYYEKVYWDVRISNGGAFVHAAPWSVADQGHANVSHGCVNLSTDDAKWFFGFSQRGDIVNVVNSPSPPDLRDPGMADWNIPWSTWSAPTPAS